MGYSPWVAKSWTRLSDFTFTFSVCSERGLLSTCDAHVSHCHGFSCCGTKALGHLGSVVVAPGLRGMWDLPRSGIDALSRFQCCVMDMICKNGHDLKKKYFTEVHLGVL